MTPEAVRADRRRDLTRYLVMAALVLVIVVAIIMLVAPAGQAVPIDPVAPTDPATPTEPGGGGLNVQINGPNGEPSSAIVTLIGITLLSVAPALLLMMTSFTKIFVVLAMTRNALALPSIPPNQVLAGLALFLSLFIMAPTLSEMNELGLQPLMAGDLTFTEAFEAASDPLRDFMLSYTREAELEMFLDASNTETPVARDEVPLTALIPAFVLSEIKSAFILGFVIFVPFLVIDLVVSAVLTSLGMMMLPPTFVSLPLKLLLFILLDGWTLIVGTLLKSYG